LREKPVCGNMCASTSTAPQAEMLAGVSPKEDTPAAVWCVWRCQRIRTQQLCSAFAAAEVPAHPPVHSCCCVTSLPDGPHHQALPPPAVASSKDAWDGCGKVAPLGLQQQHRQKIAGKQGRNKRCERLAGLTVKGSACSICTQQQLTGTVVWPARQGNRCGID
jgi:hypothetical protein